MEETTAKVGTRTLAKSLYVLECLAESYTGLTLKQLTERTNLNRSTLYRILQTFIDCGYVRRDQAGEKYYLGAKVLILSDAYLSTMDLRTIALPYMEQLQRETGELVQLSIEQQGKVVDIEHVYDNTKSIQMIGHVGLPQPMYCTASGKALLAWKTPEEIRRIIGPEPFEKHTVNTTTSYEQLFKKISDVREFGYAINWFENEDDIFCIVSPVWDRKECVAAIGISATRLSAYPDKIISYCAAVNKTAMALSKALGCTNYPCSFIDRYTPIFES